MSKMIGLPDGSVGSFPDEMSDDAIHAELSKAYPAPAGPSALGSFGRGAAAGAQAGWGPKIQAAIQASLPVGGDEGSWDARYSHQLHAARSDEQKYRTAHPGYFAGGQLLGGAAPGALAAASGAPALAQVGGLGAMTAAGESQAQTAGGMAQDMAVGAGASLLAGKAGEGLLGVVRALPRALGNAGVQAGRRYLKSVSGSLSAEEPLAESAVRAAYREGGILPGRTVVEGRDALKTARGEAGARIGGLVDSMEAKGVEGSAPAPLAHALQDRSVQLERSASDMDPRPGAFAREAENVYPAAREADLHAQIQAAPQTVAAQLQAQGLNPNSPAFQQLVTRGTALHVQQLQGELAALTPSKPTTAAGNLFLRDQVGLKRSAQDVASNEYDKLAHKLSLLGEAKKGIAGTYGDATREAIASQAHLAPEEAAAWGPANARFGDLADAHNAASEGAARYLKRAGWLAAPEMMGATMGFVGGAMHGHGAATALPAAVAMHLAKTRGASTVAYGLLKGEELAQRMSLDPATQETVARYALPLARSAQSRIAGLTQE